MNKRWLFALILVPLALAVPLYSAASWRPRIVGAHPFRGQALPPVIAGARPIPPQFRLMMATDGARFLSISTESKPSGLAMWDVKAGRVGWTKPQSGPTTWQPRCFSPDGKSLLMTHNPDFATPRGISDVPALALFDAASGAQIVRFPIAGHDFPPSINDASFASGGRQLIAATNEEVLVWDLATRREISHISVKLAKSPKPKGASAYLRLAPDGAHYVADWTYFVSATMPKPLRSETRDLTGRVLWQRPGAQASEFHFSPDGASLLTVEMFDNYEMLEVKTGRSLWKKKIVGAGIARQWRADSRAIAVHVGNEIQFLDAKTGAVTRTVALATAQDFAITPDGDQIYSINAQGQITRQRLR